MASFLKFLCEFDMYSNDFLALKKNQEKQLHFVLLKVMNSPFLHLSPIT